MVAKLQFKQLLHWSYFIFKFEKESCLFIINCPLQSKNQYKIFTCVLLTNLLVIVGSLQLLQGGNAAQQGTAPTGHNPFLHSCPSGVESVCNTVLLLIHLYITCSTNLNQ